MPAGVEAVLAGAPPTRSAIHLFSLVNRVALVTGGHRGIGLELALAMAELGAIVYCLDLPAAPDNDWFKVKKYAAEMPDVDDQLGKGRLEYMCGDVTNQQEMWKASEAIVEREGRIDIAIANAGITQTIGCLEYPAEDFKKILDINVSGVLFTAQAVGRQMERLGIPGSIILIASMNGSVANRHWMGYNTSKSAVLQMGRSLACELAPKGIRVNTISPGYTHTSMTKMVLEDKPTLEAELSAQNPMGRFGRPDELRGVALWLASDASSFCTGSDIRVDGGQ
ncbi:D-arabinitol 2-dehydrogenase [Mycena venus]|uniref:D-arabinitol 2-dehydrogenase n=1 Tax=Mycena venus TaxID=2733690 RepID=A0A8H6YK29_9AGAR|nr:D-arabinitol 2-dehydrogenase [Mycena venus]